MSSSGEEERGDGSSRKFPATMRSGRGPMVVEILDQSFESAITSLMSEVYKLCIKHVQLSGRSHIQPKDIQNAFKVVLLPSYGYEESLKRISHIDDVAMIKNNLDKRTLTNHSMIMAGRLMAKTSVDTELGNSSEALDAYRRVQDEERTAQEQEAGQHASLFPGPKKINSKQLNAAVCSIAHLLQATEMPDTTDEEFCWCSDKVQLEHNDMFLMERAEGLWKEYLEETSKADKHPFERSLIAAINKVDREYSEAEARARERWEQMLLEEESGEESDTGKKSNAGKESDTEENAQGEK